MALSNPIRSQRGTTPPLVRGGSGGRGPNAGPGTRAMAAPGFGAGPKGSSVNKGGRGGGQSWRGGGGLVRILGGRS